MFKKIVFVITLIAFLTGINFSSKSIAETQKDQLSIPPVISEVKVLPGVDSFSIVNPTFSNDGKFLAAFFNGNKSIKIYDTKTGELLSELPSDLLYQSKFVDGMEFSRQDNSKLIVMRAEAPLKIIDWRNKKIDKEIDLGVTGYKITDFAFTPDQKHLAIAKQDGIDIWNIDESKKNKSFLEGKKINALDISEDGKYLVYAKSGKAAESIGTIDISTMELSKMPLANLPTDEQGNLPDYEVQTINFTSGYDTVAGYLNLPRGSFKPDGPAGVYLINTNRSSFSGPTILSDYRLSMSRYLKPFNGILTSSFNFDKDGKLTSAIDFIDPSTMKTIKSYLNSEFKAPMLSVNISKDGKMMAAALKETDGVKLHLYSLEMPTDKAKEIPKDMLKK